MTVSMYILYISLLDWLQ